MLFEILLCLAYGLLVDLEGVNVVKEHHGPHDLVHYATREAPLSGESWDDNVGSKVLCAGCSKYMVIRAA